LANSTAFNLSFRKLLQKGRLAKNEHWLTESRAVGETQERRLCQVQHASGRSLIQPEIWASPWVYGTQRARFRNPPSDYGKASFKKRLTE